MIRSGKSSWLTLSPSNLPAWASLNGISLQNVAIAASSAQEEDINAADSENDNDILKGSGFYATTDIDATNDPLVVVPRDMVLSEARVREMASGDVRLAEILKSCETFAISPRITILIFLLYQATVANPEVLSRFGKPTPFIEYLKFMPIPSIATLYTEDELTLFEGTTLLPATRAKLKKLLSEYQKLRQCTKTISWLAPIWWRHDPREVDDISEELQKLGLAPTSEEEFDNPLVTLEDWIILDAMYRSRALEWPGEGEAMVPAIDMANHDVPANAEFEVGYNGEGALLLKNGKSVKSGDEIFISYGDNKSPLEILFSYGFLPMYSPTARSVLLSLPSPDNDPLGPPKAFMASSENCVPGIRVFEDASDIQWDSEVLWLMILNEEDGLDFSLVYGPDGERELHMMWKNEDTRMRELKAVLQKDDMFDLFRLRATVVVLQQIEQQLGKAHEGKRQVKSHENNEAHEALRIVSQKLGDMEIELLTKATDKLLQEKQQLIESPAVQRYFDSISQTPEESEQVTDDNEEDDFT